MQPREEPRFALELFTQAFFRKQCFFQRYSRIEALIDRLVNGAHAALAELSHDTIPAL
jgi:hypothetical protein